MSLKIQAVFLFLFFSPSRMCILIGLLDFREHVMCFLSRANSTARCRRCFVQEFFQVYIVFLVVASFAKTKCYSPSNLLVRSAMCRTCDVSIIDLSKMIRATFQAFYDHFSHETKHHASTVTCSESKWKNPLGQNDHSRQKPTTRWKYFFVSIIILGHEYTGSASLALMKFTQLFCSFRGSVPEVVSTIQNEISSGRSLINEASPLVLFSPLI